MTWCKGCKKDVPPSRMHESGECCEDCALLVEAMCESGDFCEKCPDREECNNGEEQKK